MLLKRLYRTNYNENLVQRKSCKAFNSLIVIGNLRISKLDILPTETLQQIHNFIKHKCTYYKILQRKQKRDSSRLRKGSIKF